MYIKVNKLEIPLSLIDTLLLARSNWGTLAFAHRELGKPWKINHDSWYFTRHHLHASLEHQSYAVTFSS